MDTICVSSIFKAKNNKCYFVIVYIVPSAPADIKAIPASNTKVIVSWLPPLNMNGEIVRVAIVYSLL